MTPPLVLSLFPGIGLLDMAFEQEGFCVVRGPDLLWGGDIRRFHPPAGVFAGLIGGPPCQAHSALVPLIRAQGYKIAPDLIPEYQRVVSEVQPDWFVMENVERAPIAQVDGYVVHGHLLNNRWLGEKQNRLHRFSFGTRDGGRLRFHLAALESAEYTYRVTGGARARPVRKLAGGKNKRGFSHELPGSGPCLSIEEACIRQGVPADFFAHSPFRRDAQRKMLGNAVAYPMALELARAVKRAVYAEVGVA